MALVKNISVAKSKRVANYEDYEELLYCTISSTINKQITSHEKKRNHQIPYWIQFVCADPEVRHSNTEESVLLLYKKEI